MIKTVSYLAYLPETKHCESYTFVVIDFYKLLLQFLFAQVGSNYVCTKLLIISLALIQRNPFF